MFFLISGLFLSADDGLLNHYCSNNSVRSIDEVENNHLDESEKAVESPVDTDADRELKGKPERHKGHEKHHTAHGHHGLTGLFILLLSGTDKTINR